MQQSGVVLLRAAGEHGLSRLAVDAQVQLAGVLGKQEMMLSVQQLDAGMSLAMLTETSCLGRKMGVC